MADRIPPALLAKIQRKLGLSRAQVYKRIEAKAGEMLLSRRHAAMALAREQGVSIVSHASDEDLGRLVHTSRASAPSLVVPHPFSAAAAEITPRRQHRRRRAAGARDSRDSGTSVWIVHGRDTRARNEMAIFLRAIGLTPLEYSEAIRQTRTGSPHPSTVLERAFATARAVIVLLTPDDEARLRAPFRRAGDPIHETTLTPQARPNVLFEAGEAFGTNKRGTILVQVGRLRPFSNVAGLHVVHLRDDAPCRQELATKLDAAGCTVDRSGQDWLSAGDFASLLPKIRSRKRSGRRR